MIEPLDPSVIFRPSERRISTRKNQANFAEPSHDLKTEMTFGGPYPRRLYKDVKWMDEYGRDGWNRTPATSREDAEVVSSEIGDGIHCPTIDIDYPCYVVPSSTPGHFHLYIDYPMPWRKYKRLLKALAKAGIVEEGYVDASIRREHTAVRVPWRKKE